MGNKIKEIGTSLTPLKNLTYLDLSDNLIFNTNQNLSKIVSNVKTLWLTYNEIDTLHRASFTGLQKLQYLNLYSNKLGHIMDGSFTGLYNLQQVILSHCELAQVSNNTLGSLPNLVYFSLNLKVANYKLIFGNANLG